MNKIFIVHYQPLELYPPIQNLIRVFEKASLENQFYILTTNGSYKELDLFKTDNKNINIIRLSDSVRKMDSLRRGKNYLKFYAGSLLFLLKKWPNKILYFETLSSFAPYLYKRFFNKKCLIYIHYHEYTSKVEYEKGMMLTKLFHIYEKYLYPNVEWLSHTNTYRMQLFKNDIFPTKISSEKILANYPPKSWFSQPLLINKFPLKIVYVGSLSMDTMYTQKFAEWVQTQNGKVIWDIYSYNCTEEAKAYFKNLNASNIIFYSGINYNELPSILRNYDVGVILYIGHCENHIYSAPNKLFEYLTCGLDAWYPNVLNGCFQYDSENTIPSIIRLDFNDLANYELNKINKIKKIGYNLSFVAEEECAEIVKCILS